MTEASRILSETSSVLVMDWPSRDVPATLAAAGFSVTVKGGPGPADYTAWEISDGELATRPLGRSPDHADLVYFHRPFGELDSIIALARSLGARALWRQSGLTRAGTKAPDACWVPPEESQRARELAAAAGLAYIDDVYIVAAARQITSENIPES